MEMAKQVEAASRQLGELSTEAAYVLLTDCHRRHRPNFEQYLQCHDAANQRLLQRRARTELAVEFAVAEHARCLQGQPQAHEPCRIQATQRLDSLLAAERIFLESLSLP
jgi:hypothetical protein